VTVEAEQLLALKPALARTSLFDFARLYADMVPSPGQLRFMLAIIAEASCQLVVKVLRGGGKTKCAAVAFAFMLLQNPRLRIFVLSGSYWQARRLYQYFLPLVANPELFPAGSLVGEPTQYLTQFREGGSLEILTASARRTRGGHVDVLCIDEAVLVEKGLIDAVWPVVRTSQCPKRIVMSTPSPEVNLDWFLRLWQDSTRLGFQRHEWGMDECHWINKQDAEQAKLMLDSETYKIEYLGEIAERTGRVWDSLLIDRALTDPSAGPPLSSDTEKWTSLDWGFVGQAVLLFCEKQAETVYIRDCRIWSKESYTSIKQEVREQYGGYPVYPDGEAVADNEDLTNMGMRVVPVIFSKDKDFLISRVRWRLEQGLLKIPNPDITNLEKGIDGRKYFTLVQQMKAYHYGPSGKPAKVNDHACDALICAMKHVEQPSGRGLPITVTSATP